MAINFNNQNQGIGTLDLSQFGLMQPQNTNMQVAEAFNYGTLPQATKSFTPKSTMTTGAVVDGFIKENPNANRGDFMKALQDGSLGSSASQLFNKNVDSLFEGVNLDKNYFGNVTPTYQGTTDGTFRGNIDIDKGSLNEKALESLPEGFFKSIGDQSSLGLPANDRYASLDSFFSPTTMNDATNTNAPAALDMAKSQIDPNRIPGRIQESVEPKQGILQGLQNKIGSGFNLTRQIPGMALSAMTGIPGAGLVLNALGKMGSNEYAQATTANMQKQNNNLQGLGLDGVSNFGGVTTDDLGRITNNGLNYNTPEGIMSGYNSGFDLASSALGRIGKIQDGLALGKFKNVNKANQKINNLKTAAVASAQAKRQAYQDKMDRAKDSAAREKARAKSITAGYGGGNDNDRPSTGPTSVGAGMGVGGGYASDYGFLKDGGSVGLASMFTRRR